MSQIIPPKSLVCKRESCLLCEKPLPPENISIHGYRMKNQSSEAKKRRIPEPDATMTVFFHDQPACRVLLLMKVCENCKCADGEDVLHFHDHAETRRRSVDDPTPRTHRYFSFASIGFPGSYFQVSKKSTYHIGALDLVTRMVVDEGNSFGAAARILNYIAYPAKHGQEIDDTALPPINPEYLLRHWEKYEVTQWRRDLMNVDRSKARRRLVDLGNAQLGCVMPEDRAFEITDRWDTFNGDTLSAELEKITLPEAELDQALMLWIHRGGEQPKCMTGDGNRKSSRKICKYCWRLPRRDFTTCHFGNLNSTERATFTL
uniref:Uncharacterized protein n=1 Tax=Octactis speculum TaxID=3111310 RepID=A0A7S2GDN2_9STRA|mmetsp:Transcript_44912/g.61363  ORF Transcript_44912/g.61363 Transcript_44912/m.61363 type:complete len:317 (+) Transcript_44912:194-1144(+)